MNATYKHLDAKLRIAELTVGQWLAVLIGVMLAIVVGLYIRPGGAAFTLFISVYLGGVPVAAVFVASMSDFNVWLLLRAAAEWRRRDGRFLPGPGEPTSGYRVSVTPESGDGVWPEQFDLHGLWRRD